MALKMNDNYFILLLSYLIGSIPSGLVLAYFAGFGDIRGIGSGNIGATNVLRTGSKKLAALTLIADAGKIILAIILGTKFGTSDQYLLGFCALIGHMFPLWLKFNGGKGIASFLGLSIYLFPMLSAILAIIWAGVFIMTRYSSLASIITAFFALVYLFIYHRNDNNIILIFLLILIILIKHNKNIIRLLKGKELKFTRKS